MVLSSLRRLLDPAGYELEGRLSKLIERAVELGLRSEDAASARELLEYNESGLALYTVLTQLYEYSVPVDDKFVEDAVAILGLMKIDLNTYRFIYELIPDENF